MAEHKVIHPTYGERTVTDEHLPSYLRTGWSKGAEVVPVEVDGAMNTILADVGGDPSKASAALQAEQSRENPRPRLVTALSRVIETHTKES